MSYVFPRIHQNTLVAPSHLLQPGEGRERRQVGHFGHTASIEAPQPSQRCDRRQVGHVADSGGFYGLHHLLLHRNDEDGGRSSIAAIK